MKVLMLTSSYPLWPGDWRGGFVREMALALMARGIEVRIAAPRPGKGAAPVLPGTGDAAPGDAEPPVDWLPSFLPSDSRAFHGAGIEANLRADPLAAATLPPFLLAFAAEATVRAVFADCLVAHWLLPMGLVGAAVARLARKPLVVVAHSGPSGLLALPPFGVAVRQVVRAAGAVACVSDAVRDRVASVAGNDLACRVVTLPLGINPRPRFDVAGPRAGPLRLTFVGRLVDLKGADLLVRAVARLDGVQVTVIGDGPEGSSLRALASRLDAPVRFAGEWPNDRVLASLASQDALVVPSRRGMFRREEGMPRVAAEAWACGIPVIASDSGGIPAAIRERGGGLLFRTGDAEALRQEVVRFRDDAALRDRLRAEAVRQAEALSWQRLGPMWVDLLESARVP